MKRKETKNQIPDEIVTSLYQKNIDKIINWLNAENIDFIDKQSRSLLFLAVIENNYQLFEILLNKGANINLKDKIGWSILHYIAQNHQIEMAKLILCFNPDLEIKDDFGNTPLWRATFSSQGRGEIIKLYLQNGANSHNPNNNNITPFILANTIANYNINQFFI